MSEIRESRCQIAFGSFIVDPVRRQLFRDGVPAPITPRAFDTLVVLISGRGRVVEKAELMRALWPDTVVEEINLNVQISTLRKALGEHPNDHRYIVTVPRRGYAFVADVLEIPAEADERAPIEAPTVEQEPGPNGTGALAWTRFRPSGRAVVATAVMVLLALVGLPMLVRQLSGRPAAANHAVRFYQSVDPEAYAAYLRGRQHWNRRTDHDLRIAVEYFRRAVEVEETAALAWSGLADSYAMLSIHGGLPPDEAFAKARDAAERALAIDEQLSEAHVSRGGVLMRYDRDFHGARDEFERAIELDPGNATAHHWYGELLMQAGESEAAIERLRHASQIDPLSLIVQSDLAWALYYGRRYDEADEQARRVLWIDSSFRPARQCLALVLVQRGEHAEALEECAKADLSSSAIAGTALVGLNEMQRARTILQRLRWSYRRGNKGAYAAARMFASLGEPASAVRWLRHAVRAREGQVAYLAIDPSLDSLRSEPGFQRLLAELAT